MSTRFVETLLAQIMEASMIPKAQVERAIGPLLSMFLADVLTETFRSDPLLSGQIAMICLEFPFKKPNSWQSTNIDYLLYNRDRKQLLFLELKTADTSINAGQNQIYLEKQLAVRNFGGKFLIEDLEGMRDRSAERGKYEFVLENKIQPFKAEIAACRNAILVYLAPACVKHSLTNAADMVLCFRDLVGSIQGSFAAEWQLIHQSLCALDDSSQASRNREYQASFSPATTHDKHSNPKASPHWQGTLKFGQIVVLCQEQGERIISGFTGGETAFAHSSLASLQARPHYKWTMPKTQIVRSWQTGSRVQDC